MTPQIPGLIEPGNVDLFAQPEVQNPDGTTSTVDSIGVNIDGMELLLPTVTLEGRHFVNELRGKVPEDQLAGAVADAAIREYERTRRHLGKFRDVASSDAYAKQLHEDYAAGKYRRRPAVQGADLLGTSRTATDPEALVRAIMTLIKPKQ